MKRLTQGSALLLGAFALASQVWAGPFSEFKFDSSSVGNTLTQTVTVKNTDGTGLSLDEFRIYLDADDWDNYSNMVWINDQSGAGWFSDILDVNAGGPGGNPGWFIAYADPTPGIADGSSLVFINPANK